MTLTFFSEMHTFCRNDLARVLKNTLSMPWLKETKPASPWPSKMPCLRHKEKLSEIPFAGILARTEIVRLCQPVCKDTAQTLRGRITIPHKGSLGKANLNRPSQTFTATHKRGAEMGPKRRNFCLFELR